MLFRILSHTLYILFSACLHSLVEISGGNLVYSLEPGVCALDLALGL